MALVVEQFDGLRVVNISDPTSPTEVGFLDTPGDARGVAVSGSLALVADGSGGLLIVRFAPAVPATVEGAVTLQRQLAHGGAVVTFDGPETRTVTTGPDDAFSVSLPPGTYTLRAEHPYHLPAEATITVGEGETRRLEAVLRCCDVDQDGDIDVGDLSQLAVNLSQQPGSQWR